MNDDTVSSTPTGTIPSLQPIRMSILGPSQSAKTSLAMDFAYSVVSDSGNVLYDHDRRGIDDDDDIAADRHDDDQGVVLFVIPQCKRALLDFPIRCQRMSRTRTKARRRRNRKNQGYSSFRQLGDELHKNMRTSCSYSSSSQEEDEEDDDELYDADQRNVSHRSWNQSHKRGLENIQIKYMDSVTDLVYFLASLGKKKKKKEYNVCTSSSGSSSSKEECRRLDAIVIDDLDCYIRSQDDILNGKVDEEGQVENGTRQNNDTSATANATATATTTTSIASSVASMITSLELQKLIQLLAIIADTANWMDEMAIMPIETTRDCLGSNNHHSSRKGVHILTCMNTDRLPLGTSLPQIKAAMSMMQNYTPSIVCLEQMPMDHPTVVHNEDRQQRVNLESFFHNKKNAGFDKGDRMVKLLSAWKGTLYHNECKDSMESRFCVAKRCWYEGMEKNFLVNMEESWRNEEEEEDEEEYELFWEL